jgi:hypothetical protein
MARNRPRGTLLDYLVAAIEPALIIIMVGSLMFFLLDLFYDGLYLERLRWILFWFVLGIVLITRISMQIGSSLAMGYGVALGGAVAVVASMLAGFQPLLLVIMGVVWWATHKLTFDCTLMDEDQDAGVGLLQGSVLDKETVSGESAAPPAAAHDSAAMDASLLPQHPWWKPGEGSSKDARRPHAPGTWLIYFTLASLPFFGFGQWFVPAVEEERRAGLFMYFLAYIASGMGLLLATSFLNLRRYLRQRRVTMPAAMTATWLTTGGGIIVGLTVLAAILPFPLSGFGVLRASPRKDSGARASRLAVLKDSGVQGDGARSEGQAASQAKNAPSKSGKPEGSGQTNDPNAQKQTSGKGRSGGSSGPGNAKSGAPRGKSSGGKSGAQGKQGSPQENQGDAGKGKNGSAEKSADRAKDSNQDSSDQKDKDSSEQKDGSSSQENQDQRDGANQQPSQPPRLPPLALAAPSWLRGLLTVAGVIAILYGLFRYGRFLLDALRELLASLFGGLFIKKKEKKATEGPKAAGEPALQRRPFTSFVNPFDSGLAQNFSPNDLVIYSFEALEAWAADHNLGRSSHETPTEFVRRLGQARSELQADATRLVGYLVPIIYGQRDFKTEVLPAVRQFWRTISGHAPAVSP